MSKSPPAEHEPPALPEHLIRLPDSQWALWRTVGLRAAGFPIGHMRALATPECAAAADEVFAAEDAAARAADELVGVLTAALHARLASYEHDDAGTRERMVQETRRTRQRAMRNLRQGRLPDADVTALVGEAAIEAFRASLARLESAWSDYRQVFAAAIDRLSWRLQEIAGDERFREAITWQNRRALHTGIDLFRQQSPAAPSSQRKKEMLIASYVQRYCAKNETIGFFGPVGWAGLAPDGAGISVRPGPSMLATRAVYFEGWCIDALAEALSRNEALQPWIAPRRMPFIHLDGTTLHLPLAPPATLSPAQAAVLRCCDGERPARAIAEELIRDRSGGLSSEQEVYDILKTLRAARRIAWKLEVPAEGAHPEQHLRQLLDRIDDGQLRCPALEALDELVRARDAVARAAGDAGTLDRALDDLEATFTRLTGAEATRHAGETYAARTLVYEDCRRDVEVALGPEILKSLGPPLTLLLTSARWFTCVLAARYRPAFQEIYAGLARRTGSRSVDFASFWLLAQSLVFDKESQLVAGVLEAFQERWAGILAIPSGERQVYYASAELRPRVLAAFAAPGSGWPSARYQSPDIMLAASSVEAIQRGDYHLVMGELHLGVNPLSASAFVAQHPTPEALFQALERDMPEPRVIPVFSKQLLAPTTRTLQILISPKDFRLVFAHDSCGIPSAQALPTGALVVEECGDGLVVRARDGRARFDIVEAFGQLLAFQAVNSFKILPPRVYTPRVTFDRLVVCRESWRFTPAEIAFAYDTTGEGRFIAARRWSHEHGIPRFVFVKAPVEKKPTCVDLDSPISVDIFAKLVRRTLESGPEDSQIVVTEMLPDPDDTWLPDAEGQRYTSELRFVAVDRSPGHQL